MSNQDSRPKKDERAYEAEYCQDSDGHVRRCADFTDSDLSRSRSDGSLSFEKDLSPGKQGENEAGEPDEEQRLGKIQSPEGASNEELTFFEREKKPTPTAKSGEITRPGQPKEDWRAENDPSGAKPPGRKENSGIPASTKTSSAPSSGKSGQAFEPTQAETEGTPSSRPAQEAGTSSGSSRPG